MRWRQAWRQAALAVLLNGLVSDSYSLASNSSTPHGKSWTIQRKLDARERTRGLWTHGFDNYMTYAFPLDELMPLSCTGRGPDWENPHNVAINDVAGNFSLTLLDVLDTFIVMDDPSGFETAVRNTLGWVSMDVNTKPQVFETTIRVLGGLLSAHIFASDTKGRFHIPWYRGELLSMAHDLGRRLLPAFATPTGIPYARLNLRHGVPFGESMDTCTAGAGSLILEFGTLSRLTGDDRFEKAAYKAFFAIWNRKSDIGLVGNTINTWTGKWLSPEVTSIGAGIDSFYEYAFKWFILSGEVEFLDVWHEAYAAIMRYSRGADGFWFRPVNIHSGDPAYNTVDSLSAFWPGLQVLAGDVENAIKSHLIYWNLWKRNSGLPEVWDIHYMQAVASQYPLRPEFAESTYYLYRATKDPFYLEVGERILQDLTSRTKVACGLAGISDLKTNKQDDRMESFVLSETLKYLYLLFDESNALHSDDSNFVFTTEGHILTLDSKHLKPLSAVRRKLRRSEDLKCPSYTPIHIASTGSNNDTPSGLVKGVLSRPDVDYARALVAAASTEYEEESWSPNGQCAMPVVDIYSYDFILSTNGQIVPEDLSPSLQKITEVEDGFVLHNVSGIRTHIVSRLDRKGYDITKLGPYTVRRGQIVYVNDTDLFTGPSNNKPAFDEDGFPLNRAKDVQIRFFLDREDPIANQFAGQSNFMELRTLGFTSTFGADPGLGNQFRQLPLRFLDGGGSRLVRVHSNPLGCSSYEPGAIPKDSALLVHRGECSFLEKLVFAKNAKVSGVIVINSDDMSINASADNEELDHYGGDLDDTVLIVISRSAGEQLMDLITTADAHGFSDVMVAVEPEGQSGITETRQTDRNKKDSEKEGRQRAKDNMGKILYVNGHPLLNTRLLV